jgi:hypothetical protein
VALLCTVAAVSIRTAVLSKLVSAVSNPLAAPLMSPLCSQDYFHDRIAQLTFTFPEDAITSTGLPFWSAPKRFPRPVTFDAADPAHASFVQVCVGQ